MTKKNVSLIKKIIKEIDSIIENFLIDINAGKVGDLSKLDEKINQINSITRELSQDKSLEFESQFEMTLIKIKELREFLSNQLETTATQIKLIDKSSAASKRYNCAANDNV